MLDGVVDNLLDLIRDEGYSLRESTYIAEGGLVRSQLDVSKGDQNWSVVANNRYISACELLEQLGTDLCL